MAMSERHTPGPWEWELSADESGEAVINILAMAGDVEVSIVEGAYFTRESDDENDANADLFCAAPDLLEALEGLYSVCVGIPGDDPRVKAAQAAIAKARGTDTEAAPPASE